MTSRFASICPVCLERVMPWKEATTLGRGGRVYHQRCWDAYWDEHETRVGP